MSYTLNITDNYMAVEPQPQGVQITAELLDSGQWRVSDGYDTQDVSRVEAIEYIAMVCDDLDIDLRYSVTQDVEADE